LIRTGTVTEKDFLGTETYKFADGTTAKSKVFIIKEIRLGNKTVTNVKAAISNSIKAPLLLGQSLLNKFGKVIIDYNKGVITFQE
jgi:aspartyl protease family protein